MTLDFDKLVKQKVIHLNREDLKGVDDLDTLVKIIKQSTLLRMLDLRWANLTLSDRKLTNAIAKNTTIKRLWLQYNNISSKGAKYLANALKENNTLQSLYLSGNNIGDEGSKYIANMLPVNKTLQRITLDTNNIGDQGAQSIATSLVSNMGIREIWLGVRDQRDTKLAGDNNISKHIMERIKTILNDPKRNEFVMMRRSIAKKNKELEGKDAVIAKKDRDLAKKDRDLAKKDKHITSLKSAIRVQLQQLETIIDPVDLTSEDDDEPANKRARIENSPKSRLALLHEQSREHSQRLVKVKQEKNTAEAALDNVRGQKQAVEANLEEARGELEDAEELVGQQTIATNIWQGRFDELVSLAEAAGVDGAAISGIRNRSLASGS